MESKSLRRSAIPPSDFLYYDPYYLLLKERSKAYPKVVEKFYRMKPVESVTDTDSLGQGTDIVSSESRNLDAVADIVDDLSKLMKNDSLSEDSDNVTITDTTNLPDPAVIQALISTCITESSAFDPILASRVRRLGAYVNALEKVLGTLKSQVKNSKQESQIVDEGTKNRLDSNTRAMNALYADIDRYKAKLAAAEEKLQQVSPNLQAEFAELEGRYFVAMKIIDRMNWPSPEEGTVEVDTDPAN